MMKEKKGKMKKRFCGILQLVPEEFREQRRICALEDVDPKVRSEAVGDVVGKSCCWSE